MSNYESRLSGVHEKMSGNFGERCAGLPRRRGVTETFVVSKAHATRRIAKAISAVDIVERYARFSRRRNGAATLSKVDFGLRRQWIV
jgi:hypothetical protein